MIDIDWELSLKRDWIEWFDQQNKLIYHEIKKFFWTTVVRMVLTHGGVKNETTHHYNWTDR